MAKIIKLKEEDLKNIIKKVVTEMEIPDKGDPEYDNGDFDHEYDQSSDEHMFKPNWMYMYVGGKGFELSISYEIGDKFSDDGGEITLRYIPELNQLDYVEEGYDFNEHLIAMVKQDFIKRFGISKEGMRHPFRIAGNLEIKGTYLDWQGKVED